MSYIKVVVPMKNHRLFMEMESGSTVTVDLSVKLNTIKYADLKDDGVFMTAVTDGNHVIWGGGQVKLSVNELMDAALLG